MRNIPKIYLTSLVLAIISLPPLNAEAGFMPYGRIFKAVKDERPYITQAQDTRLQLQLHKAIILNCPSSITEVSSYVFAGQGFLVGEVENEVEREDLINRAKEVKGLYGISYFLPQKKNSNNSTSSELEIKLKGMIDPKYPSSKVTVKVVQDNVVILGVLSPQEQQIVCESVQDISGTAKIINFIQAPQQQKRIERRFRPLRNLFSD
ncbi:BON domain-containing protein [Maridesulfovibrio sp.]|uniref:BON domain-containing protein n=1 Tax=Maridesulfovibrio sp. TaxID=2795000 RepID=UPI003BACAEF0